MNYKLGSLFDGSGGFPLAGAMCGIKPVWASEVEPYPIAVTKTRFPMMAHLGDISKINGAEIEPVDIITFGSPCQDLSVAGKRAGLKHEANGDEETTRSGLFMEAVRIIKEMRDATNGEYPRYALWENVPGAFSSNKGEDFRIVLEELIKIIEPRAVMPPVPQKGWPYADSYIGNGWSIAYRVFDAQYWGVPQRRRRIHLIADFRGESARKVLFEREGLRGYFAKSGAPWKAVATDVERSVGTDDRAREIPYTLKIRSGCEGGGKGALIQTDRSATLATNNDQYLFQPVTEQKIINLNKDDVQSKAVLSPEGIAPALYAGESRGGGGECYVLDKAITLEPGIASREGGHIYEDVSGTLRANAGDNQMSVAYSIGAYESNAMKSANPHAGIYVANTSRTLDLNGGNPACNQGGLAIVEPIAVATQQGGAEITENGICPTITAASGMSGNNQPWVCHRAASFLPETGGDDPRRSVSFAEEVSPTLRAGATPAVVYDVRGNGDGNTVNTITGDHNNRITDYTSVVCEPTAILASGGDVTGCLMASGYDKLGAQEMFSGDYTVVEKDSVFCIDGDKLGKAERAGGSGMGVREGDMYTLTAKDRHAVAYASDCAMNVHGENVSGTLMARDYKGVDRWDSLDKVVAYPQQAYDKFIEDDIGTTLKASGGTYGGGSETLVATRYIVRRLAPTECARLQGFADRWGDVESKDTFTEEEYQFWLEVRKTHALINDKQIKEWTLEQMLTWYNKLQTDSAEYKMWGNGIALPPALYCMQGITEVLNENL